MFKYQLILVISCALSAILFSFVRLRPQPNEPLMDLEGAKPNKSLPTPACLSQPPYTVIHDWNRSSFTVCQGGYADDLTLTCPNKTIYNPEHKRCDPVDPCFFRNDGDLIEAAMAVHLPKNRRYHVCHGRAIRDTKVCPDEKPYFNGVQCVESDSCSYLPEGTKFGDESDLTKYFICKNKIAESLTCPPGHYFSITHCVAQNRCEDKPDGTCFPDIKDPTAYYECHGKRTRKRKCDATDIFSTFKKRCVPYDQCSGKPDVWLPVDTPFLKRSREVIRCDEQAVMRRGQCPNPQYVFDEHITQCRPVDECLDLKKDKLFPRSTYAYTSCQFKTPEIVDITLKMNMETGEAVNRCASMPDGFKLGLHIAPLSDPSRSNEYVECQHEQTILHHCPSDHIYLNDHCQFQPCIFKPSGHFGPYLNVPNNFYYCQKGNLFTFRIPCPTGTMPSSTYNACVADPHYVAPAVPLPRPKLESQFSYTDSQGARHSCREADRIILDDQGQEVVIPRVLNPWTFQCQDAPCTASLIRNYSFVPIDFHRGGLCIFGYLRNSFDCKSNFVNLKKTWTGDFSLDSCSPENLFTHEDTLLVQQHGIDLYLNTVKASIITEDSFSKPIRPIEPVIQGLESIVGPPQGNPKQPPKPKCTKTDNKVMIVGYPHLSYNCKTKAWSTCSNDKIFLGWQCFDMKLYPVFGDCTLFSLGKARAYQNSRRIFKCPDHRPLFNYVSQQCETSPPPGQLLCEQSFFANYEAYADPSRAFNLPEPVTFKP